MNYPSDVSILKVSNSAILTPPSAPEVDRKMVLEKLQGVLDVLKELDGDMPIGHAAALVVIALYEDAPDGLAVKDVAALTDVAVPTASRYIAAFGKAKQFGQPGHGFVTAIEDPAERRRKIIKLTPRGRAFINRLTLAAAAVPALCVSQERLTTIKGGADHADL